MWWGAQNVRYHQTGTKRLRHPTVGELELSYEVMELTADRRFGLHRRTRNEQDSP
jgi:hypothetical protein